MPYAQPQTAVQALQILKDQFSILSPDCRLMIYELIKSVESAAEDRGYVLGREGMGKREPSNVK